MLISLSVCGLSVPLILTTCLVPLLHPALERHLALPHRQTEGLDQVLAATAQEKLFLDGTDRPIRRPKDPEKQQQYYSGRKKRHTVKNLVLTQERTIKFLSPTAPGRPADKRLAQSPWKG